MAHAKKPKTKQHTSGIPLYSHMQTVILIVAIWRKYTELNWAGFLWEWGKWLTEPNTGSSHRYLQRCCPFCLCETRPQQPDTGWLSWCSPFSRHQTLLWRTGKQSKNRINRSREREKERKSTIRINRTDRISVHSSTVQFNLMGIMCCRDSHHCLTQNKI